MKMLRTVLARQNVVVITALRTRNQVHGLETGLEARQLQLPWSLFAYCATTGLGSTGPAYVCGSLDDTRSSPLQVAGVTDLIFAL